MNGVLDPTKLFPQAEQTAGIPPLFNPPGGAQQAQDVPPATEEMPKYKPPKSGGLPLEVIASIQSIYAKEQEKQERLQGMNTAQSMALKPGWGGQGR